MPIPSTPHDERPAKAAEAKERARIKKRIAESEARVERVWNGLPPELDTHAKKVADKYISRDGGPPVDVDVEIRIDDDVRAAVSPTEEKETKTETTEIKQLRLSADHIIASKNVLDLFAGEFGKVVAGEQTNGKLLYLIATSRLFDRTMHAAIKGTSAGGKSEMRKRILEFFPPEGVVSFTSLSEKSLIYHDGDFSHKILSMGEAAATEEQDFQDYLLRELMSEGRLRHATVQRVGNTNVAMTIEKKGPVAFLVTTTKSKMHPENETRMLSLEIDDSAEQTRKVLTKVAQVEGLNQSTSQVKLGPWQDYQRWLEQGERRVVVPFAAEMFELIPAASVRLRRDVGQVIRAIKAHALLHREHRERDGHGRIVADVENDYSTVRELMIGILATGSGVAMSKAMAETIEAVRAAVAGMAEADGASAQDVALKLKLDKSAAWRRLTAARQEGFVANLEQRKGMPGKYRVTSEKVAEQILLPSIEKVQDRLAAPPSGSTPSETVQPCNPERKAEESQLDDGCKEPCNPAEPACNRSPENEAVAGGCFEVASPNATIKSLSEKAESPPVAGLQAFSEVGGSTDWIVANGYAISTAPEDRRPPAAGARICRVSIREIRHPAISAGPYDDLEDFK
jgi:hypothetical protein